MKAVIMAGGQGTRFWPLSRTNTPKQFLDLFGNGTLLQGTVARLLPLLRLEEIFVVCRTEYRDRVRSQLPELAAEQVLVEPLPRNTAPCIGLAALLLEDRYPDEVMLVLPADHVIRDVAELHRVYREAEELARRGYLVTFGIQPTHAATGYGYIEKGEPLGANPSAAVSEAYQVARFVEKPDQRNASAYLQSGRYLWNSGMFAWTSGTILEEIRSHLPRLFKTLQEIKADLSDVLKMKELFEQIEPVSIDYGIMEKSDRVVTLPCSPGWNDVGSWDAIAEVAPSDEFGMVAQGDCLSVESRNCIVYTPEGKLVALLDVEDLIVADTADALLICRRGRSEDVRRVVERLAAKGCKRLL